jgi:hypothetical protein
VWTIGSTLALVVVATSLLAFLDRQCVYLVSKSTTLINSNCREFTVAKAIARHWLSGRGGIYFEPVPHCSKSVTIGRVLVNVHDKLIRGLVVDEQDIIFTTCYGPWHIIVH